MIDCYYTNAPVQLTAQNENTSTSQMICYKGVNIYVRPYDASHYQVVGLCTTNPAHYLQKNIMPGALIPLVGK